MPTSEGLFMNDMPRPDASSLGLSAGELLRQARERAGLNIATLAATLKVSVQRLEALEAGRHEALPDATFTRALALSVCRVLKIDPAPVLAALPEGVPPPLVGTKDALGAPMPRHAPSPFGNGASVTWRLPWRLAAGLLILAAALWWLLPPESSDVVESAHLPSPLEGSASHAALAKSAMPMSVQPAGASPEVKTPALDTEREAISTSTATMELRPDEKTVALRLQAREPSWIQVVGASGRVWLQRTVQPGEVVRLDEDLPLAVIVGRADATDVVVRGERFDLGSLARNNVARFQVR
jgi:cytoskeleton protein RodZ